MGETVLYGENASGSTTPTDTSLTGDSYAYNGAQGKLTNSASGITLMGARPYQASTGRFTQPDPVEFGCANDYTYAFGDPIDHPDLSGQKGCQSTPSKLGHFLEGLGRSRVAV